MPAPEAALSGSTPRWLDLARRIQAIAQAGLTYTENEYDTERYRALHRIAVEMMAAYGGAEPGVVEGIFQADRGYVTPKVDVRGVVFREDELLLVKERSTGQWTLPGGFADVGEPPGASVEREVREESGYRVRAARLLALYDRDSHDHIPMPFACYKVFIDCDLLGGEPATSMETAEIGFFQRDALPELDTARVTRSQIERMWELHGEPARGAEFD